MSRRLLWAWVGFAVLACSSTTQTPNSGAAGDGAGAGTSGTTGAAGSGGSSASGVGGTSASTLISCTGSNVDNNTPGAIANPADFSNNTDTDANDAHTLFMGRADMVRRVMSYQTGGIADHKHTVVFTDAQLNALLGGMTITVSTDGPPSNAATGHGHTIMVRPCGITPGFGGAGGGAATTGAAGTSGTTTTASLIDCAGVAGPGAIANPVDFSVNPDTGSLDMHLLSMSRGDLSRGQSNYKTGGPADHQHEVVVTFEERQMLTSGHSIVVNTMGPPLSAPSGHGHTIKISACPSQ